MYVDETIAGFEIYKAAALDQFCYCSTVIHMKPKNIAVSCLFSVLFSFCVCRRKCVALAQFILKETANNDISINII